MMNKLKGGIETIVATVIIVAIVVGLIVVTVIPLANQSEDLTGEATGTLSALQETISPD